MGKRNFEEQQNGAMVSKKQKKSQKETLIETVNETLNDTVNDETDTVSNGLPKTRRDLLALPYEHKLAYVSVIANPMATKKLTKKLFKLLRKAGKISRKTLLRIGLKDVQLRLRKGSLFFTIFFKNFIFFVSL